MQLFGECNNLAGSRGATGTDMFSSCNKCCVMLLSTFRSRRDNTDEAVFSLSGVGLAKVQQKYLQYSVHRIASNIPPQQA